MKTKAIILIAVSAIITVSFTFASRGPAKPAPAKSQSSTEAPAGGLLSEDKF